MSPGLTPRPPGRRLARSALALAALALPLAFLEAGSYLVGTVPGPVFPLATRSAKGLGRYDHELFWRLAPDAVGEDGLVRTNSLGWRGPEPGPKAPGSFRVLVLGESSTFGWEVPWEACYVARLQALLDGDGRGPPVQLVDAAVPGYTLVQGYRQLERDGPALEPDAVLVAFGINDFLPVAYLDRRTPQGVAPTLGLDDWALSAVRRSPASRVGAWLTAHSNAWRLLRSLDGVPLDLDERGLVRTDDDRPRVPEATRRLVLERLASWCAERGLQLVIVVPVYRRFEDHARLLRRFAAEHDLPLVDLPALLGPAGREGCFADAAHPNVQGHARIADALHRSLASLGW